MITARALVFAVALVLSQPSHAQQTEAPLATPSAIDRIRQSTDIGDIILIVDFSQSMWAKIEGRVKYLSAGEAAQALLNDLAAPSTSRAAMYSVGLMLYGHRAPAPQHDCNDIELVVPPAPITEAQRGRIMGTLRQARPRGVTPIAASLEQAAQALRYRERPATIILVSDGIETCQRNPCEVARRLHADGVHLIAHVVGYGVDAKEFKDLKCIAEATGGIAVRPKQTDELVTGMRGFAERLIREAIARRSGTFDVSVVDRLGHILGPEAFETTPEIIVETEGAYARRLSFADAKEPLKVIAGLYTVRLHGARVYATVDLDVKPGASLHARLEAGDGRLEAVFRPAPGIEPFPAGQTEWQLSRDDGEAAIADVANPATFGLPPGRYEVSVGMGPIMAQTRAQVFSEAVTRIEIIPQPQFAPLSVRLVQPQPTFFAKTQIPRRLRFLGELGAGQIDLGRGTDALTAYVPPGRVHVVWVAGDRSGGIVLEVPPAGMEHVETLALPSVEWTSEWQGPTSPDPIVWTIEPLLEGRPTGARETRSGPLVIEGTIPPGDYRVTASRGPVLASADVKVPQTGVSRRHFILRPPL